MTTTPPSFPVGSWAFSSAHGESGRIVDLETVWNHTVYQVWIPRLGTVERVPAEFLAPAQPTKATGLDRITYVVAAARIADALTQDVLLAPLEAGVIPRPHQLHALTRAVTGDRVRYLLADEVGLGKTIEAGLIFRELKLRGLVMRGLVMPPKGLVIPCGQKLPTHFGQPFRPLIPSGSSAGNTPGGTDHVGRRCDQVVSPADAIAPIERRWGWFRQCLVTAQSVGRRARPTAWTEGHQSQGPVDPFRLERRQSVCARRWADTDCDGEIRCRS